MFNCFLQISLSCLFSECHPLSFQTRSYATLPFLISLPLISFLVTFFFDISLATFPKSSGDSRVPFIAQSLLLFRELSSLRTRSLKMHVGVCPFSVYDLLLIAHCFRGQNSYCCLPVFHMLALSTLSYILFHVSLPLRQVPHFCFEIRSFTIKILGDRQKSVFQCCFS